MWKEEEEEKGEEAEKGEVSGEITPVSSGKKNKKTKK